MKKILSLVIIMLFLLVPCCPAAAAIPAAAEIPAFRYPNVTDVINDIQPDEVNLDAAENATLPGGGTIDDLMDKTLLEGEPSATLNPGRAPVITASPARRARCSTLASVHRALQDDSLEVPFC